MLEEGGLGTERLQGRGTVQRPERSNGDDRLLPRAHVPCDPDGLSPWPFGAHGTHRIGREPVDPKLADTVAHDPT